MAAGRHLFVTDGYEETRVVKFDKNGKFLMAWGERGAVNGKEKRPGYFNTVHGIAIDNQRRLYINDRSNRRIQIFDENGKFIDQWYLGDGPTATYHIFMTADQHLWMSDGHGNFKFYKYDLTGKLLYTWGTMTPEPGGLWGRTNQRGSGRQPVYGRGLGRPPAKIRSAKRRRPSVAGGPADSPGLDQVSSVETVACGDLPRPVCY